MASPGYRLNYRVPLALGSKSWDWKAVVPLLVYIVCCGSVPWHHELSHTLYLDQAVPKIHFTTEQGDAWIPCICVEGVYEERYLSDDLRSRGRKRLNLTPLSHLGWLVCMRYRASYQDLSCIFSSVIKVPGVESQDVHQSLESFH